MKALAYRGPWDLRCEERAPGPMLRGAEVRIRVAATGICGTDLGIVRGDYAAREGVILGHESAGMVVEVGPDVRGVAVGARVVIDPTYHCGWCRMCRTARMNHCEAKAERESGVSCDGTFAEQYVADERFVYPLASHVAFAEASLSEPLSCALTGIAQLRVRADLDVAVIGAGPMGMLYAWGLAARGVTGTLTEASAPRRARAARAAPPGWRVVEPEHDRAPIDLGVDTSGVAFGDLLARLRRGGQLLMVGLTGAQHTLRPAELADRSLSVLGSIDSIGTFGEAVAMIERGIVPARRLISHELPMQEFRDGFALLGVDLLARRRDPSQIDALKVVLTP